MPDSPRTRLCERCWRPLPAGTVFRVFRHPDPAEPDAGTDRLSFRHMDGDPACTGAQVAGTDTGSDTEERAA